MTFRRAGFSLGGDGLLCICTASATYGLVVAGGYVVDAPPYAARWTLGRRADEVWDEAEQHRARVVWRPDEPSPPAADGR